MLHRSVFALLLFATPVRAQTPAPRPPHTPPLMCCNVSQEALRVFLDCSECDIDYVRTNVGFVHYVRDRATADLHLLVTTERTGGGGRKWTLAFIGLGRFLGHDHTMTWASPQTATEDEDRGEFVRILKLGLASYASDTSLLPQLSLQWTNPSPTAATTPVTRDPWNYWVFRLNGSASVDGEEATRSRRYDGGVQVSRTTDNWKISSEMRWELEKNHFRIDESTDVDSRRDERNLETLVVKSLGPHWSAGAFNGVSHSSFSNEDLAWQVWPVIEWDVFPYSESTRRIFTVRYAAGPSHYRYTNLTIFDKLRETIPEQNLEASLGLRQPWGSLGMSATVRQQIDVPSRYRVSLRGETDIRLVQGLSLNLEGRSERIRNQISLPKAGATAEEILLRIQQLATGFSYSFRVGISFSFGSIFNNIVNPRIR